MEELYSIMRGFLEVEYNLESLLYLLKAAEATCTDENQPEVRLFANSVYYYLSTLHNDLSETIHRLDTYIVDTKKK